MTTLLLAELCLQGKAIGRTLVLYDDNGYIRATVTGATIKDEIVLTVKGTRTLRPPFLTSHVGSCLECSQFTFSRATEAHENEDHVIVFPLSVSGCGYLLPESMREVPSYA